MKSDELTDQGVVLDVDHCEQHRVVDVGHALAAAAQRHAQERRRMVELDPVHLGADDLGDAVVRRRSRVQRTEGEPFLVLVDLLGDERDVEEELGGQYWSAQ